MLKVFFLPYLRFLAGAAYNVQQTLDGLHLHSSNFLEYGPDGHIVGSYWSASEAMILPLGGLIILAAIIAIGILLAGYVIGRWKGVAIAAFVICLPGLLSTAGIGLQFYFVPDEYVVGGTGVLGDVPGMVPLVVMALAAGWALAIALMDTFNLGERYRNIFDHIWYSMAVIAGVFFVGDSAASRLDKQLAEYSGDRRFAAGYIVRQLHDYSAECLSKGLPASLSCAWAGSVQERLAEFSLWPSSVYFKSGPKATDELYQINGRKLTPDEIISLRREIIALNNQACPTREIGVGIRQLTHPSDRCQRPPAGACRSYPEPLEGLDEKDTFLHPVHIASECIIPSLVRFREQEERLSERLNAVAKSKHLRWLFYICFSLLAGAKVASATAKVVEIDRRPSSEKRRLLRFTIGILVRVWRMARVLSSLLWTSGRWVVVCIRR